MNQMIRNNVQVPELSVLLPSCRQDMLQDCVRELRVSLEGISYELIVASEWEVHGPDIVHVHWASDSGLASGWGRAFVASRGVHVLFWGEDTVPQPNCFQEMLCFMKQRQEPCIGGFRYLARNKQELQQPLFAGQLFPWRCIASRKTLEALGVGHGFNCRGVLALAEVAASCRRAKGIVQLCPDSFIQIKDLPTLFGDDTVKKQLCADASILCNGTDATLGSAGAWEGNYSEMPVPLALGQSFAARDYWSTQVERSSIPSDGRARYRLSVLVSLYNSEKYIRGLLEDLQRQTIAHQCEIIIVETGSQQNERQIITEFQERYNNIRYLHTDHRETMYAALNRAIQAASSDIVVMANADDRHFPSAFEEMLHFMETHPEIGLVYADSGITSAANVPAEEAPLHAVFRWPEHRDLLLFRGCYVGPQPMWRKSLNERFGYFDEAMRIAGDYEMWLRFSRGAKLGHLGKMLGVYLQNPGGLELSNKERCDYETNLALTRHWPKQLGPLPPFDGSYAIPITQDQTRTQSRQIPMQNNRIIALLSSFNEGDIIYHVIGDLIDNGIEVYLMDNNSTDNTVEEASRWLGKGLIKIERFPDESDGRFADRCKSTFVLKDILARKEELALKLNAAWYIQADADEFRESCWPGMKLADAIRKVDGLGYNAINFELLNFRPVDDGFVPGSDVRLHLTAYEAGKSFDALQIRAFKNPGCRVEMARNGGCNIQYPGRKVFPVFFILRHYPIRGETHGRRKIFQDRVPRFAAEEVAHRWHIQYNDIVDGKAQFLHDPNTLIGYDQASVCAGLHARFTDDLLLANAISGAASIVPRPSLQALTEWTRQRLGFGTNLPSDLVIQGEKALNQLLPTQEHGAAPIQAKLDPALVRLLMVLLDAKVSLARLNGESLLAQICSRLKEELRKKLV